MKHMLCLVAVLSAAPLEASSHPPQMRPTEVVVVGTIHDWHKTNEHYREATLRDILIACEPNAILVELPPTMGDRLTVENGRMVNGFEGQNEGLAAQQAAERLHISIFPYDMDRREEVRRENGYWRRSERAAEEFDAWLREHDADDRFTALKTIDRMGADVKQSIICFAERGAPEIINSEAFDAMMRAHWRLREVVLPELMKLWPEKAALAEEQDWLRRQWHERNRIMVQKIVAYAAQYPGGRIALTAGAEHRYILRDLLKQEKTIVLKEYYDLPRTSAPN